MTLLPHLEILPAPQRTLWPELAAIPTQFVLYGGTALALRLGHRRSVDFDLFSHDPLDHAALERLPILHDATTLQELPNTRTVLVDRGGTVKVSFFGGITFGRICASEHTNDGVLRVASLIDLAGTKIKDLLQRVESKDYRDIIALLGAGVGLPTILGAARVLFGPAFNPLVAQKSLCYFEGGDLDSLTGDERKALIDVASHDVLADELEVRAPRLDA